MVRESSGPTKAKHRRASGHDTAWKREVARWYDALVGDKGSDFHRRLIFPQVIRLLDLKKGERLLDVACGQGAFCRVVERLGILVTGLDASKELIAAARRKSSPHIRYVEGDARQLDQLPAESFDALTHILAIQNIEPAEPAFEGCGKVLRQGGRMAVVMTHPCFRIPRQSGWGWDDERKLLYRRIDHYLTPLKIPVQIHPGSAPHIISWTFHRPLQAYVEAMVKAGLLIHTIEEWPSNRVSQPGARAKAENRARREIPLFLALRAVKVEPP